jgi:hypothetical protein
MKMDKIKVTACLLFSILFLTFGCTTVKILNVNKENDFMLTAYKTYDFYSVDVDTTAHPEFNKRLFVIRDELMNQLANYGLKRSANNPDLFVNIGIKLEKKMQTRETEFATDAPFYMGARNYSWHSEEVPVGEYHEGTFSIDFVESKDNSLKCMAVADAVVVKNDKNSKKNIEVALKRLFKKINKK